MLDVIFPKLTLEQCELVIGWIEPRLRSLKEVLAALETPEILKYLDSMEYPQLDPLVKKLAEVAKLCVGGSNADASWKKTPTYQDIDVFFVIPNTELTDQQAGQLKTLLGRRWTDEVLAQRDECTIPDVALSIGNKKRFMDVAKVGVWHNGVIWSVPSRCQRSGLVFNDGRFTVVDGLITHESQV
jgi:hypothetical protein